VSTHRTDELCARLSTLADTVSVDNFGEVVMQCIAESLALCSTLERELAEMKSLIALAVDCGEACGMDGAYPEAWERMKAAAANTAPIPSADAHTVIADLLANAVPVAAESGDKGMVFVEMTEAEWQRVVEATARAKAFLAK
jgi:hypothetical protein